MKVKHFLGLRGMTREDMQNLLDQSLQMKKNILFDGSIGNQLENRKVMILFYENSTRTRLSFELAASNLGATPIYISADTSSVTKGETLRDTLRTLEAMGSDCIVVRHPMSGILHRLSHRVNVPMINAGDGMNEHPTQALLDMMTIQDALGSIENKRILLVGDIMHSRVARSDIWGLSTLGAKITVAGPREWIPAKINLLGVTYAGNLKKEVQDADVIIALRIQKERQDGGSIPSLNSYNQLYGINDEMLNGLDPKPIILHPGPVNRGIEITSQLLDGKMSKVNEQVLNGVAVRMAVLKSILEGSV